MLWAFLETLDDVEFTLELSLADPACHILDSLRESLGIIHSKRVKAV